MLPIAQIRIIKLHLIADIKKKIYYLRCFLCNEELIDQREFLSPSTHQNFILLFYFDILQTIRSISFCRLLTNQRTYKQTLKRTKSTTDWLLQPLEVKTIKQSLRTFFMGTHFFYKKVIYKKVVLDWPKPKQNLRKFYYLLQKLKKIC